MPIDNASFGCPRCRNVRSKPSCRRRVSLGFLLLALTTAAEAFPETTSAVKARDGIHLGGTYILTIGALFGAEAART